MWFVIASQSGPVNPLCATLYYCIAELLGHSNTDSAGSALTLSIRIIRI